MIEKLLNSISSLCIIYYVTNTHLVNGKEISILGLFSGILRHFIQNLDKTAKAY